MGDSWSLAERLTWLIETVPGPDGAPFTHAEIARQVALHSGESCNRGYIGYLARGERDNPTMRVLTALAQVFGVPPEFFFADDVFTSVRDEVATLVKLRAAGVDMVALRALADLTPEQLGAIIDHARAGSSVDSDESGRARSGS